MLLRFLDITHCADMYQSDIDCRNNLVELRK